MTQMHRSHAHAGGDHGGVTGWVGWVLFAGVVVFLSGFINIIDGLVALFNTGYYRVPSSGLVLRIDYAYWGWTLIAVGIVLAATGYGIAAGQTWARVVGVVVAVLSALVNLAFIAAYPVWIALVLALHVVVIYALIAHGQEAKAFRHR
jgi:hypothetical protein